MVYLGTESEGIRAALDRAANPTGPRRRAHCSRCRWIDCGCGRCRTRRRSRPRVVSSDRGSRAISGTGGARPRCSMPRWNRCPANIPDRECSGLVANVRLQSLAEAPRLAAVGRAPRTRGRPRRSVDRVAGEVGASAPASQRSMTSTASPRCTNAEFPGTHTSAARMLATMTVIVATDAGGRLRVTSRGACIPTARATSIISASAARRSDATVSAANSSSR